MTSMLQVAADLLDPEPRWQPQAKQQLALELIGEADETLYGGAAGGGKTYLLVQHAIDQCLGHPGNRAVIFRRVWPSLQRTILPLLLDVLPDTATWNGATHEARFDNGSVLELAHLQHSGTSGSATPTHLRYQGAAYGFVGFEEVTEFEAAQYDYMLSRLRAPADGIRPHIVATANPGGPGHAWVRDRWVRPTRPAAEGEPRPGEVWRPQHTADDPRPMRRAFVPATLDDNPALTARDPEYAARMATITSRSLRRAMRDGDWDAIDDVEGALWRRASLDLGRVTEPPAAARSALGVDPSDAGAGDAFGVVHATLGIDGDYYVPHAWAISGVGPGAAADRVVKIARDLTVDRVVVESNNGGRWVRQALLDRDADLPVRIVTASQGKLTRAEPVAALFEPDDDAPDHDPARGIRAHLVGDLPDLEHEWCTYTGSPGEPSPNLLDASVWALTDLSQRGRADRRKPKGSPVRTLRR